MTIKNFIGTSGWYYKHWKNNFYPDDLTKSKYLSYYGNYFSTVEINNTFYKIPNEKLIYQWLEQVPQDFIFSIKANRYITHIKRLKECDESLNVFLNIISKLKINLGLILFQWTPFFK